jgi:hypothetical protein
MSAIKSEVKAGALFEAGVQIDDRVEAAERNAYACAGEATAHAKGITLVQTAQRELQALLEADKLDMETAKIVQGLLGRVHEGLVRFAQVASNNEVLFRGKMDGLKQASDLLRAQHQQEVTRAKQLRAAEAEEAAQEQAAQEGAPEAPKTRRKTGTRPPASLKAQRLAEEAAAAQQSPPAAEG